MQDCFILPGPPNFRMSLQKLHSAQSLRVHGSHRLHRTLRRRMLAGVTPGLDLEHPGGRG